MAARLEYITQKQNYIPEGKNYLVIFNLVVFLQVFFANLYNISLFNELIFIRNISYSLIGLTSSIYAFAYLFGPLLFQNVVKKLGTQRILRVIIIISMIYLFVLLLIINPVILIVINIIDGFINAVFWSNITYAISSWQKTQSNNKNNNIQRNFGLSWNFGALLAQITGYIAILYGLGDYQLRIISWIIGLGQIPLIMTIKIPNIQLDSDYKTETIHSEEIKEIKHAKHNSNYKIIMYPVAFMLIGEVIFQISKSLYCFVVPFLIYSNPNASMIIYLTTFLQQISQIVAIILVAQSNLIKKFKGFIAGILGNILIAFSIRDNFVVIGLVFLMFIMVSIGFFGGLIYMFSSQLLVEYNLSANDLKYSSIYETVSGLGFGITPLIIGIYIDHYMIEILRGFGAILLMFLMAILLHNQFMMNKNEEQKTIKRDYDQKAELMNILAFNNSSRTIILKYVPFANLPPSLNQILKNQSIFT